MSWYDVREFYIEPDDDYCSHGQTEEQADGVYCLDCGEYLGTSDEVFGVEFVRPQSEGEAVGQSNTGLQSDGACTHPYPYVNYENLLACPDCGWVERPAAKA